MRNLHFLETQTYHILSLFICFILILSFVFVKMQIRLLGYEVLQKVSVVQNLEEQLVLKKTKYVALFSKIKNSLTAPATKKNYSSNHTIIYMIGGKTSIKHQ